MLLLLFALALIEVSKVMAINGVVLCSSMVFIMPIFFHQCNDSVVMSFTGHVIPILDRWLYLFRNGYTHVMPVKSFLVYLN